MNVGATYCCLEFRDNFERHLLISMKVCIDIFKASLPVAKNVDLVLVKFLDSTDNIIRCFVLETINAMCIFTFIRVKNLMVCIVGCKHQ